MLFGPLIVQHLGLIRLFFGFIRRRAAGEASGEFPAQTCGGRFDVAIEGV